MHNQVNQLSEERSSLQVQVQKATDENNLLQHEIQKKREEKESNQQQLHKSEEEKGKISDQLQKALDQNSNLLSLNVNYQKEQASLNSQLQQLQAENTSLNLQNQIVEKENQSLQNQLQSCENEKPCLDKKVKDLEDEISTLRHQILLSLKKLKYLSENLNKYVFHDSDLQIDDIFLVDNQNIPLQLNQTIQNLESQYKSLQELLDSFLDSNQENFSEQGHIFQTNNTALVNSSDLTDNFVEEIDYVNEDNYALHQKINDLEAKIEDQEQASANAIETLNSRIQEITEQLQDKDLSISNLVEMIPVLQKREQEQESLLNVAKDRMNELQQQVDKMTAFIQTQNQTLADTVDLNTALKENSPEVYQAVQRISELVSKTKEILSQFEHQDSPKLISELMKKQQEVDEFAHDLKALFEKISISQNN